MSERQLASEQERIIHLETAVRELAYLLANYIGTSNSQHILLLLDPDARPLPESEHR